MPEECKQLVLQNVWRTCNKIRAAIFRSGLNLWEIYKALDRNNVCLISESKFVSVLNGPLKKLVGLSDQEICDLADYFKVQDGRILYTQFCRVINDEGDTDLAKNKPLCTGLEWEDPYHVNVLSTTEERRFKLLLTKIATTVSARRILLRPYFQDYELVSKNNGTITFAHFSRILHFLKIFISDEDYYILKKKFLKDGYTMNYVAFLAALDRIIEEFQERGIYDVGGDLLCQFPGRILTADLPKLPRPEIGNIIVDKVFGSQKVFHPIMNHPSQDKSLQEVILRLQQYVFSERVRVGEFFKDFDKLNCGRVPESVFRRCLEAISVGETGMKRLYFSPREINSLVNLYRDPNDPTRIMWRVFESDIDSVFTKRGLEKWPEAHIDCPPAEVKHLPRVGNKWNEINQPLRDKCEETIELVRRKVESRRITLRPSFNDLDKNRNGHVTRRQFRTVLISCNLLLTDEQLYWLEQRYNDDLGFNYYKFLKEVEPEIPVEQLFESFQRERQRISQHQYKPQIEDRERNIVDVLAKIKKNILCYRIKLYDFLSQHDPNKELAITENDFKRSLDIKLNLTPTEVGTIIGVFRSPSRPGYVDYLRFCDVVEEAFTQKELIRAPLVQPFQHFTITDAEHNFLDFEDRQTVSTALHKIAGKRFDYLHDFFKAQDRHNSGTIEESDLLRGLAAVCLHNILSSREIKALVKCFGKIKGYKPSFDYREFMHALEVVKRFLRSPAL